MKKKRKRKKVEMRKKEEERYREKEKEMFRDGNREKGPFLVLSNKAISVHGLLSRFKENGDEKERF